MDNSLIKRQDAINAIMSEYPEPHYPAWYAEILKKLPSTEPEYKELKDWKTDFKGFIDALDIPRDDYRRIMEYIDEVPFAQTERKKGKWIDYSAEGYIECPFCHSATNCEGNKEELHYCFFCGAELR